MKNRRETTNRSVKFKGSWEKFNVLLDVVELCLHEFLSEKNPSGLVNEKAKKPSRLTIDDDQTPRKKRSLHPQPKKKTIDAEVLQNSQLVLPGSHVDWIVVVAREKEKEMLQSETEEKSSSDEAVRLRPEIPDLNLPPPLSGDDDMMIDNFD